MPRRPGNAADDDCPIAFEQVSELWLGPGERSCFRSREELREAWELARDYMLRVFGRPGRRCAAWWEFDAPIPYPGYDRETAVLYEANLLDAEECAQLEAIWRREYKHSLRPGFSVTVSPEVILEGARAQRAHWTWAGIPASLLERWEAERKPRRRGRQGMPSEVAAIK
jgi:hypothetical protein